MGFNLGLRDVACLAELLAEQSRHGDPGDARLLADYDAWRAADRGGIIAFTDGLVRLFSSPLGTVRRVRNLGLLAFDILPPAKAALSRLSTGASRTNSEAGARSGAALSGPATSGGAAQGRSAGDFDLHRGGRRRHGHGHGEPRRGAQARGAGPRRGPRRVAAASGCARGE